MPKLVDLQIREVSGVDKAANKRRFLVMKRQEGSDDMVKADTPKKTENGQEFPAEAYLYVPDPEKPSTWKLRIWEDPEKKVTAAQVGRAIAALSPGGFRGQQVDIPADEIPKVKAKLRSLWREVNPDKDVSEMPDTIKKEESKAQMLWRFVKSMFGGVDQADAGTAKDVNEILAERQRSEVLWDLTYALQESLYSILEDPQVTDKAGAIDTVLGQFRSQLQQSGIVKRGAKISADRLARLKQAHDLLGQIIGEAETSDAADDVTKGVESVSKEDLAVLVGEAVKPLTERLEKLEKADPTAAVAEAVNKALEPVLQRLEALEKAKGVRKSIDGQDGEPVQKKSIWAGLL